MCWKATTFKQIWRKKNDDRKFKFKNCEEKEDEEGDEDVENKDWMN